MSCLADSIARLTQFRSQRYEQKDGLSGAGGMVCRPGPWWRAVAVLSPHSVLGYSAHHSSAVDGALGMAVLVPQDKPFSLPGTMAAYLQNNSLALMPATCRQGIVIQAKLITKLKPIPARLQRDVATLTLGKSGA